MPDLRDQGDASIDATTIRRLIDDWVAYRDAAAALLVDKLRLDSPRDVLRPENRGRHELVGTGWAYRTHGIGVDVTRTNGHGGIDSDFSTTEGQLFAAPDYWRLVLFAKRSIHDPTIDSTRYVEIIRDAEPYRDMIDAELRLVFRT